MFQSLSIDEPRSLQSVLSGCSEGSMAETRSPKATRRPASRTSLSAIKEKLSDEASNSKLAAQRDVLLQKMAETEYTNHSLRTELLEKDQLLGDLRVQLKLQQEDLLTSSNVQSSIETTRGHLQKQLKQKEADCNRLSVQIRNLESQMAQDRIEMHHIKGLLSAAKDKAERDKEALKKATRAQKQRAIRSEDALERAETQLMSQGSLRAGLEDSQVACDSLRKENSQLIAENCALKVRMSELEHIMARFEGDAKVRIESTTAKLHERSSEINHAMLDNDKLRLSLTSVEDKLHQSENELSHLRTQVGHYENLIEEYRGQLDKSRREADETFTELTVTKKEATRAQVTSECDMEKVKARMQSRLQELEPLPEMLKSAELKLQDSKEQLQSAEKRNLENTKLIAELTSKVEDQADQINQTRRERITMADCTKILEDKVQALEVKMKKVEAKNAELSEGLGKKDAAIHQMNMGLDERARENDCLTRQLEKTLSEARRHGEQARDLSTSKDRAAASRILDLETQITQTRADNARLRRDKEETEKKCNSRLYDLKDRLEQSHASNRSMQNYVQFLKNSYANMFGDNGVSHAVTSSPSRNAYK